MVFIGEDFSAFRMSYPSRFHFNRNHLPVGFTEKFHFCQFFLPAINFMKISRQKCLSYKIFGKVPLLGSIIVV